MVHCSHSKLANYCLWFSISIWAWCCASGTGCSTRSSPTSLNPSRLNISKMLLICLKGQTDKKIKSWHLRKSTQITSKVRNSFLSSLLRLCYLFIVEEFQTNLHFICYKIPSKPIIRNPWFWKCILQTTSLISANIFHDLSYWVLRYISWLIKYRVVQFVLVQISMRQTRHLAGTFRYINTWHKVPKSPSDGYECDKQ